MSKVLVVGNGFDIALGFRSTYLDFINTRASGNQNAFWPFRDMPTDEYAHCSLYRYFYDYFQANKDDANHIRWIDLESELLKYVRNKGVAPNKALVDADKQSFATLKRMLHKYIEIMPSIEPLTPDKNIIELLQAIKIDGQFDKAYSFNYTNLRDELTRFGEFSEDELPSVVNIHGTVSNDNPLNIVLGINEDSSISQDYRFMFKSSQTVPTDLAQDMAKANEVIFYGISFGEIDFTYFKSFFKYIANKPLTDSIKQHITIFTFGENSVNSISNSILAMDNILIHDLKEHSYFNIIDMEKLWLPGYDETAFQGLINRLKSKSTCNQ